jgi:hypothetical protein
MEIILILMIALSPSLFSLWVMKQADARAQARLQLALDSVAHRGLSSLRLDPEQDYVEGIGFVVGDFTCRYNARSSHIRCAVNPFGPCEGCSQYEPRSLD